MKAIIIVYYALTALSALPSFSQELSTSAVKEKLDKYAIAIATEADPAKAKEFLAESSFLQDAMDLDENLTIKITAYAQALRDLDEYVSRNFRPEDHNNINSELTVRLDRNKPLCEIGVCPQPEKFISWLDKYKKFPQDKKEIFEKAIRKWEVVFGTVSAQRAVEWGQAGTMIVTRDSWLNMVLRERNAVILQIPYSGKASDRPFLQYNPSLNSYLDERALTFDAAKKIITSSGVLTQTQLDSLAGKPFNEQLYLLGQYFDGSQVSAHPELKPYIDRIQAARNSAPAEIMSSQQREMLSQMLKTSLTNEIKGTKAGDRINAFYNGRQPPISVEYCGDCYSKYEGGKIIIDAALIEQYMKVKGYKAEDLFKNKAAVDDIARFISPAFVTAASYQMTDEYFSARDMYNPPVQERAALAYSMQGLYTTEKFSKDAKFKGVFEEMSASNYASRVITVQTRYEAEGQRRFTESIAQLYFSDMPSAQAARSQILQAVNDEISRRQALDQSGQAEAERLATLSKQEAYSMSAEEFCGSVADMKMETLMKVRSDMMSSSNPDDYFRSNMRTLRRDYNSMTSAPTAENKVPVPGA
ncbi:MAG: hypothetical protein GX447_04295 [Elusimicrobia bacterium]|nr:hypothetical protein [Elusimicrobiota bacterium]